MSSHIAIPIRRQTYEDIFETPPRHQKEFKCPDAPKREVKIFTPDLANNIKFEKLRLDEGKPPSLKRRKLNSGDFSISIKSTEKDIE
jgi:hypothetical protein